MFDILPPSVAPRKLELSPEMADAKAKCRAIFRDLRPSESDMKDVRQSMLGNIGRMGDSTLRHKVRSRAKAIIELCGDHFPDLELVLREAVECRNYFVHGSETSIDYGDSDHVSFFVDVLEFVFAASELIDTGWDMVRWSKTGTTMSHPFGRLRVVYREKLRALTRDLGATRKAQTFEGVLDI
jgi:hypothetical protein